jgi:hypothetical protein
MMLLDYSRTLVEMLLWRRKPLLLGMGMMLGRKKCQRTVLFKHNVATKRFCLIFVESTNCAHAA